MVKNIKPRRATLSEPIWAATVFGCNLPGTCNSSLHNVPRLIPLSAHYFKDGIYILVQEQNNNKQGNHITLPRIEQAAYAMVDPTSHVAAGGDIWNNAVTKHDWLLVRMGICQRISSDCLKSFPAPSHVITIQ